MMLPDHPQMPSRQRGATLAIALIFLVILTLLGLSAMRVTVMEERMGGNTRDRDRALQAAETALRDAEFYLVGKDQYSFTTTCANGLCANGSAPDWTTYAWNGTKDVQSTTTIPGLAPPRYFIEFAGFISLAGNSGSVNAYRITVRATGGNTNTQVFLQEVNAQ